MMSRDFWGWGYQHALSKVKVSSEETRLGLKGVSCQFGSW